MSNFAYKDAKGQLVQVPARYGDMTRQVAQILKKNSENTLASTPMIACYIKEIQYDQTRLQDPTFVSTVNIRERAEDPDTGEMLYTQGAGFSVERIMPSPYLITFAVDIWTSNTDQKMQLWEQLAVLFNPSLELQTNNNFLDWTSLTVLTLENMIWSSRQIPQGLDQDIDILTMSFKSPIWITPPAKVKKLGIITKIIANIYDVPLNNEEGKYNNIESAYDFGDSIARTVVTPGNFDLLVLDNVATVIKRNNLGDNIDISSPENTVSWHNLLDLYPGQFRAGLSQVRLLKPNNAEIVAYISLDPKDDTRMILNIDQDTVPSNTIINGRGTIDAIINPETFNPTPPTTGVTYLILEDINPQYGQEGFVGVEAWKNSDGSDFTAHANDIILWDGLYWNIVFDSTTTADTTYITNIYTGVQYKWQDGSWTKSYEGVYDHGIWRLIL
jgi:hypothetical protein